MGRFQYAFRKARGWQASLVAAAWAALRYAISGDTGYFRSHGGWRRSRISRKPGEADSLDD